MNQTIQTNGKIIGEGTEAIIWEYNGFAWKVFKNTTQEQHIQWNHDFLIQNRNSGVVPLHYFSDKCAGYIKMELLSDFITAEKYFEHPQNKTVPKLKNFLQALAVAASKLDCRYHDLANLANIAVQETKNGSVKIMFYEAGQIDKENDTKFVQELLWTIAKLFKNLCYNWHHYGWHISSGSFAPMRGCFHLYCKDCTRREPVICSLCNYIRTV